MATPGLPSWLARKILPKRCPSFQASAAPPWLVCHRPANGTNILLSQGLVDLSLAFWLYEKHYPSFSVFIYVIALECHLLPLVSAKFLKLLHRVYKNKISVGSSSFQTLIHSPLMVSSHPWPRDRGQQDSLAFLCRSVGGRERKSQVWLGNVVHGHWRQLYDPRKSLSPSGPTLCL